MHTLCMATKTIFLRIEAFDKLKRARRYPEESFSEVVLRASWPGHSLTGRELLAWHGENGPFFSTEELDRIESARRAHRPGYRR